MGRLLVDAMVASWYVTSEVRKRGLLSRLRSPRETKTFATENEAKLFARAKLDEGLAVFAGTINPHVPRRLIPAAGIHAWLAEDQEGASAPHQHDTG
ncbi:hypothetical protein ACVWZ4_004246 [Bradyrhizobium sp. USDA 4472]